MQSVLREFWEEMPHVINGHTWKSDSLYSDVPYVRFVTVKSLPTKREVGKAKAPRPLKRISA